jgi:glycosyltransferase involved in cell wall biosynthesis
MILDRTMTASASNASETGEANPVAERRVLICAAEFPPLGGGGVLRIAKLAKYLPPLGWRVTVACSDEPMGEAVDPTLLEEIPESVRIMRLRPPFGRHAARVTAGAKTRVGRRSPIFGLLYGARAALRATIAIPDRWLAWALTLSRRSAADLGTPDVIVTSGPPHSVHIAGAVLGRRLGIPLVMDMRDEWSLRPLMRSRLPWRRAIDERTERWCLRRAAQLIVVSEASAQRYASRYPWLAGRVSVIPNGFDPADLPDPDNATHGEASDERTIGYSGTFQVGMDLRPLFEAIGRVLDAENADGRRTRLAMLGAFRPGEVELARQSISNGALSLERFLPHRDALARIATWDALLVVADDGAASMAGKVYEYLALRKPVLVVAPEGPATHLIATASAGVSAAPDDSEGISRGLRRVLEMSLDPTFKGAPDEILDRFDRRCLAQVWSDLLGQLVTGT